MVEKPASVSVSDMESYFDIGRSVRLKQSARRRRYVGRLEEFSFCVRVFSGRPGLQQDPLLRTPSGMARAESEMLSPPVVHQTIF
jgi:hypothetical protein